MEEKTDIVFINPGDKRQIFQGLSGELVAIEPPYWIAVLSSYLRNRGFLVKIIDSNAENISPEETAYAVNKISPLLSAVIVYGSQPSASTQNMTIAGKICKALKNITNSKVIIGGLHPSSLPEKTLKEEAADFVIEGEGFVTLVKLLEKIKSNSKDFKNVPGLWYRQGKKILSNQRAKMVSNLDEVMPIAAWDLLPMEKYRAHNWHCFDDINRRQPYAAIYTSLGCPYSCEFCCINAPFGQPGIRYRSPKLVVREIDYLVKKYGVKNIKFIDELFVLNEKHYMTIVEMLIKRKYKLNIWAYARLDTLNMGNLKKMKKAGINWLALGIESANKLVRDGVNKGVKKENIKEIVRKIQLADIRVVANFIFGLPDDDLKTMKETLDFADELNAEWVNFYCAMAYPGSKLYNIARKEGWKLPEVWHGYSQHSYETLPLPTKYLSAKEVLRFRDKAFNHYFKNPRYLNMIRSKFGADAYNHVKYMTKTKLKRKLFEQ